MKREKSYQPPFSGSRGQPKKLFDAIHKRWIAKLLANPPEGVPSIAPMYRCRKCHVALSVHDAQPGSHPAEAYLDDAYWPETWAVFEDGKPAVWGESDGRAMCTQCGFCTFYVCLESRLGADWGACTNANSQYDGQVTFEHWTCRQFQQ